MKLHWTDTAEGNLEFATVLKVLRALGLRLRATTSASIGSVSFPVGLGLSIAPGYPTLQT